jgi:hypothetical protein
MTCERVDRLPRLRTLERSHEDGLFLPRRAARPRTVLAGDWRWALHFLLRPSATGSRYRHDRGFRLTERCEGRDRGDRNQTVVNRGRIYLRDI